jgi:hypothetical protein
LDSVTAGTPIPAAIVSGGLRLMSIGLDYLASQIDKYLGES